MTSPVSSEHVVLQLGGQVRGGDHEGDRRGRGLDFRGRGVPHFFGRCNAPFK